MSLGELSSYDALFDTCMDTPASDPLPTVPFSPTDQPGPLDIDALLENPHTAALVSAQLRGRRPLRDATQPLPTHAAPAPAPPTANAITKPRTKKKLRPKDKLEILQKHLDGLVDQVKHLSLRNRQLSKKKDVLEHLVKEIDRCEELAQQFQRDIAHHQAHPSQPPRGAAVFKDWTPQQFLAFYKGEVGRTSRWVIEVEAAGGEVSAEAAAALEASSRRILDTVFYTCHKHKAFIPRVKAEVLKQFPAGMSEEEHWKEVVRALELTQEQVEDLLVAREVYHSIMERMEREQEVVQASIHQHIELAATPDSYMRVLCLEEDVVARISANLQKRSGFTAVLAMFVFLRALTPLQVAKCGLHAHPLFPDPICIMNCIHASYGHDPGVRALLGTQQPAAHLPLPLPPASAHPGPLPAHPGVPPVLSPSLGSGALAASSSGSLSLSLSSSTSGGLAAPTTSTPSPTAAMGYLEAPSYLRLLDSRHLPPLQTCCSYSQP